MHFTTLFLLENETLDNISFSEIEEDFANRFCYCCGETTPKYRNWCDSFQIGGRWCDILEAKRGLVGKRSWCNENEKRLPDTFSVVEIEDLTKKIDIESIYAIATKSRIYEYNCEKEKFQSLLDKINNKKIKGVIALIDCHD